MDAKYLFSLLAFVTSASSSNSAVLWDTNDPIWSSKVKNQICFPLHSFNTCLASSLNFTTTAIYHDYFDLALSISTVQDEELPLGVFPPFRLSSSAKTRTFNSNQALMSGSKIMKIKDSNFQEVKDILGQYYEVVLGGNIYRTILDDLLQICNGEKNVHSISNSNDVLNLKFWHSANLQEESYFLGSIEYDNALHKFDFKIQHVDCNTTTYKLEAFGNIIIVNYQSLIKDQLERGTILAEIRNRQKEIISSLKIMFESPADYESTLKEEKKRENELNEFLNVANNGAKLNTMNLEDWNKMLDVKLSFKSKTLVIFSNGTLYESLGFYFGVIEQNGKSTCWPLFSYSLDQIAYVRNNGTSMERMDYKSQWMNISVKGNWEAQVWTTYVKQFNFEFKASAIPDFKISINTKQPNMVSFIVPSLDWALDFALEFMSNERIYISVTDYVGSYNIDRDLINIELQIQPVFKILDYEFNYQLLLHLYSSVIAFVSKTYMTLMTSYGDAIKDLIQGILDISYWSSCNISHFMTQPMNDDSEVDLPNTLHMLLQLYEEVNKLSQNYYNNDGSLFRCLKDWTMECLKNFIF